MTGKISQLSLNRSIGKTILIVFIFSICVVAASAKGNKYGLFIGINEYPNPDDRLAGCVNDAIEMQKTMVGKYGFNKSDTTLLTDQQATRDNIVNNIKKYEQKASAGDMFVMHYSGHGTLFPDRRSNNLDETTEVFVPGFYPKATYDSALVPFDAASRTGGRAWRNLILDDELYEMFSAFTEKGVQVILISDSCHSGSIAKGEEKTKTRNLTLIKAFGVKSFDEIEFCETGMKETKKDDGNKLNNGLYLALTGAKDSEFALDMGEGKPMGLFTSNLLVVLNNPKGKDLTYKELINVVSPQVLKVAVTKNNPQTPQLDSRFGNPFTKIFTLP
jgi:hypothetical protein